MNPPPFYIGQAIVLLKDIHLPKVPRMRSGDIFIVKSLHVTPCKCQEWMVYFGISFPGSVMCAICNVTFNGTQGSLWLYANLFAGLKDNLIPITPAGIINNEWPLIFKN